MNKQPSSGTKPRLLVLTSTFPRWPDDNEPPFVYELSRRLVDDFDVTVLAPHAPGAALREKIGGLDVRRFRYAPDALEHLAYEGGIPAKLKGSAALWLLTPLFAMAQLWASFRLIRKLRPDVVHAHWLIPQGLIAALLKNLGRHRTRVLITAHGADLFAFNGPVGLNLKRRAIRNCDHATVVSHGMVARLVEQGAIADKVSIAPMGIDLTTQFTPREEIAPHPTLLFVGRLVEKKGVADLLKAMPEVLSRIPETRLLILGYGPLRQELEGLVRQLEIEDAVEFLGKKAQATMPDIYRQARLAVLPFRVADDGDQEGLGLVAVEAIGCGLPVIVGDVPAIRDVVTHAQTGWIVPSNSPHELAAAIIRLLEDRELAQQIRQRARLDVVKRFDWAIAADRYRDILQRLSR